MMGFHYPGMVPVLLLLITDCFPSYGGQNLTC